MTTDHAPLVLADLAVSASERDPFASAPLADRCCRSRCCRCERGTILGESCMACGHAPDVRPDVRAAIIAGWRAATLAARIDEIVSETRTADMIAADAVIDREAAANGRRANDSATASANARKRVVPASERYANLTPAQLNGRARSRVSNLAAKAQRAGRSNELAEAIAAVRARLAADRKSGDMAFTRAFLEGREGAVI